MIQKSNRRSNWLLVMIAAMMALTASSCEAQPNSNSASSTSANAAVVQVLDPAAAAAKMEKDADLQILDVRTPEEVSGGVIQGAKTVNWFDADFVAQATKILDKNHPILVYCKLGGRSAKAADALIAQGFTSVFNLDGGITRWEAENHPVQKQ